MSHLAHALTTMAHSLQYLRTPSQREIAMNILRRLAAIIISRDCTYHG